MSIIDHIKRLISGSPDAQAATNRMIEVLAAEAIKTGNPDALVAVASQWEQLIEGTTPALPAEKAARALAPALDITTVNDLRPVVIKVMQNAYMGGVVEVTTRTIQKQVDLYVCANGGWKDADLEDADPRPGIQYRWKKTLSQTLRELRDSGDISNDPRAWKTYVLAPQHIPVLPAAPEQLQLNQAWEIVQ